ncbi:serine hydrolase [Nocardioides sp.]|uniref:serine hydrolase n=1 Tax=Nocardioides sp. TaxID=35761 RepID=UPI002723552F|nr:serine hydrolase [Nocardioides sp.]MDO9457159.1 serine hydrolase [Nocardioides sp.]
MPDVVSLHVVDAGTGEVLVSEAPDTVLRTASVAKVLVLSALAVALEAGDVAPDEVLSRTVTPRVGDSGLWHLMTTDALPVLDVALLVGAVSDNWATNVLVDRLGHDAVNAFGLRDTGLWDVVRDTRGPSDPPTLSTGTAREWTDVLVALHRRTWVSAAVSERVLGWLAAGLDHSLVASAFALDPLVADGADGALVNKTGTDTDVRCDVGLVTGPTRVAAYACLGNGDPAVLVPRLRAVGDRVRDLVAAAPL